MIKTILEKSWGFSFGLQDALFRLGSKLFRVCRRGGIFRCTCATFRIRHSLYLALVFFASVWAFFIAKISLIRICNMQVYTHSKPSILLRVFASRERWLEKSLLCDLCILCQVRFRAMNYVLDIPHEYEWRSSHKYRSSQSSYIQHIIPPLFCFALETIIESVGFKGFAEMFITFNKTWT